MSTKIPIYIDEGQLEKVRKLLDEAGYSYLVEVKPDRPKDLPAPSEGEGRPKTWREMAADALKATGPKKSS